MNNDCVVVLFMFINLEKVSFSDTLPYESNLIIDVAVVGLTSPLPGDTLEELLPTLV